MTKLKPTCGCGCLQKSRQEVRKAGRTKQEKGKKEQQKKSK